MHFYHPKYQIDWWGVVLITSTAFYAMGSFAASPGLAAQLFNGISIEAVSNGPVLTSFASTRLSISYGDRDSHEYPARPMRAQPLVTGTWKLYGFTPPITSCSSSHSTCNITASRTIVRDPLCPDSFDVTLVTLSQVLTEAPHLESSTLVIYCELASWHVLVPLTISGASIIKLILLRQVGRFEY